MVLFLLLFSSKSIQSQIFYVSTQGNDSNPGTESLPFKTINNAIDAMGASGGTCIIREGYYHESVLINDKNNIIIKAFPNEKVIINGTKSIETTWTQSSFNPNTYETILNEDIWQLFIDDEQQVMARWPNAQFHDDTIFDQSYWSPGNANAGSNGIMVDSGNLAASGINAQGALAIANVGSWKTWTVEVLSHTPGNNTFTYETAGSYLSKHHYYFLEGKIDFLDTQNEWFYDSSTKKLSVWGNPSGKKIQGKVQSYAFEMYECSNIKIQNLNFFATTVKANRSSEIELNNCLFSYPSCSKRMLGEKGTPHTTELKGNNKNSTTGFKIYQCLFEHTDGDALYMIGKNNIVEDCYFHHIDYTVSSLRNLMTTVVNNGDNGIFTRNTVHTTGASSTVHFIGSPEVSYNNIYNTGSLQSDGSIVQMTRESVEGSEVHHNWFHDSPKSGTRYDAPVSDPELAGKKGLIHHNVMWNLSKALMIKGDEQQIYNNTCFDNTSNDISVMYEVYADPPGGSSNGLTITKNNAADKISGHRQNPQTVPGTVSHNVYSTTSADYGIKYLLNDPDNYDFTPKSTSTQLIDSGTFIEGINDGFSGSAPDIGAYEIGDRWTAGVTWTPDFYPWSFLSLSSEKKNQKIVIKMFPNTVDNQVLNISIPNDLKDSSLTAFNIRGQKVLEFQHIPNSLSVSSLNEGLYFFLFSNEEGLNISKKIIIN